MEEAQAGESGTALGSNPVADQIIHTSFEEAASDQRPLETESSWHDCMAKAGYPGEASDTVGSGRDTNVDSDNTEAAVHNVECREESELPQTYVDVLSEVQEARDRRESDGFAGTRRGDGGRPGTGDRTH